VRGFALTRPDTGAGEDVAAAAAAAAEAESEGKEVVGRGGDSNGGGVEDEGVDAKRCTVLLVLEAATAAEVLVLVEVPSHRRWFWRETRKDRADIILNDSSGGGTYLPPAGAVGLGLAGACACLLYPTADARGAEAAMILVRKCT